MRYGDEVRRGAWANALGLLAKVGAPLSYVVLTRMVGAEAFGEYLLGFFIANLLAKALGAGFMDATTVFASPAVEREGGEVALDAAATALRAGLSLALFLSLLAALLAQPLTAWLYPGRAQLGLGIALMSLGAAPEVLTRVSLGLGKAHLEMRWDPLLFGLLAPALHTALSIAAWALGWGLPGLFLALTVSQGLVALASLGVMRRYLSLGALAARVFSRRSTARLVHFGLSQALNLGVTRYAARVDVMMLGAFGLPAWQLGWYATAAMVTMEVRQLRVIYATIATPLIARAKRRAEMGLLGTMLESLSRRASLLAVPTLLVMGTLIGDLLGLFDSHYGRADFVLALLITPALSCAFGFAGVFLVASGHHRVNLFNGVVAALVNTLLNALWIPPLGLLGAALATATSQLVLVALENVELARLEHVRLAPGYVLRVLLGGTLLAVLLTLTSGPASVTWRALAAALVIFSAILIHATYPRLRPHRSR